MDKINIYINSKNRDLNEQISNFTVRIPQNLLRLSQGEYFTLTINGFDCYNSWFNCSRSSRKVKAGIPCSFGAGRRGFDPRQPPTHEACLLSVVGDLK